MILNLTDLHFGEQVYPICVTCNYLECLAQRRGGLNISAAVAAQLNEQGKEEMNDRGARYSPCH